MRFSALFLGLLLAVFIMHIAFAQAPKPCTIDGYVVYDTGTEAGNDTNCSIYNSSGSNIANATCNASGYYTKTFDVSDYADVLTVNCTDGTFNGTASGDCSGGSRQINVTIDTPEFPDFGGVPGILIPVLIATSVCLGSIVSERKGG